MKYLTVLVLLIFSLYGQAYTEIQRMEYISGEINPLKVGWIIYDIDNTLLHPEGSFGSVEWVEEVKRQALEFGLSKEAAEALQHKYFGRVQALVSQKETQQGLAGLTTSLFATNNWSQFAITARNYDLEYWTSDQMKDNFFDFSNKMPAFAENKIIQHNGIAYASGGSKLKLVLQLIELAQQKPRKIIIVDDKDYNLIPFDNYMKENPSSPFQFVTYRYDGVLERTKWIEPARVRSELITYNLICGVYCRDNTTVMDNDLNFKKFADPVQLSEFRLSYNRMFWKIEKVHKRECQMIMKSDSVATVKCHLIMDAAQSDGYDDYLQPERIDEFHYYVLIYNEKYKIYEFSDFAEKWTNLK